MNRRWLLLGAWLGGAALLAWLIARQDWSTFGPALLAVGPGVIWISLFHLVPMLMDTAGWRSLLPADTRPGLSALLEMRWYGESVNALLPAAQIGGDLLRGRLAHLAGVPGASAAASELVDLTLSVVTLLLFLVLGAAPLAASGGTGAAGPLIAGGLGLAATGLGGFFLIQHSGILPELVQRMARHASHSLWRSLAGHAAAFTAALAGLYNDRRALWRSSCWQLAAWLAGAGEIWLALRFLGQPVSLTDAVLLESLVQAVRNAAFAIPGALGAQEGGLMLLAPLAGLSPEMGLAVSLLKRVRELILGVPGLIALYFRLSPSRP